MGRGAVLVLIDSEDDCPKDLVPEFLLRARAARSDMRISVVLAKQEFEAWFIAAAPSLAGKRGLPADLEPPPDPEGIRGAKEWLAERMSAFSYSETVDQAKLTAAFDLESARTSPSFDKCYREVTELVRHLRDRSQSTG